MPPPHSLTYCPAQVQRADGSGVWIQQKPPITQNQPQGTHLSGSPQTNPRTIFPLQKNNAKVGSPIMPGTAQQSPKKEKLKIPQVSCSMARPPRSPCHQAGVTGWSPLQPERCTDSITTFGIPPPRGCCSTGSTRCPSGKQYLCQCFQLGLALLSQCKIHVFIFTFSKRHQVTSFGLLFSKLGCPDLQGGGGTGQLHQPTAPELQGCQ